MHPALEQLHKILKLEVTNGYPNKAVIGGLPKMLSFWEPNARRAGLDPAFIDAMAEQLRAYPDLSQEDRPAAIQTMLKMVREAAAPGPGGASTPRTTAATAAPAEPAAPASRTAPPSNPPLASPTTPATPTQQHFSTAGPQRAAPMNEVSTAAEAPAQTPASPPATEAQAPPPSAAAPTRPAEGKPASNRPAPGQRPPPASPAAATHTVPFATASPQPVKNSPPPAKPARPAKTGKPPAQPPLQRGRRDHGDFGDEQPVDPRPRRSQGPRPLRAETPLNPAVGVDAPLTVLRGVGPETAGHYARLGIASLRDLLYHFPRRYDDYSRMKTINRLEFGEECTVIGTVWEAHLRPIRGGPRKMLKVVLSDTTGMLEVTFFNQDWLARQFIPGRQVVISGRITQYLGHLTIVPQEWEELDRELLNTGRIVPVYPANADLKQKTIRKLTSQVVQYWAAKEPDPLPPEIVERAGLMRFGEALAQVHFPDSQERLAEAQHRLAFDELLLLQLGVLRQRRQWQSHAGQPLPATDEWLAGFIANLPYTLTGAQQRALADIRADMARDVPMNRLLQGDVGAGKTAVAALALALAVQGGAQGAIMAPTSILAEQHFRTLSLLLQPVLGGEPGALRLLQGSTTAFEKAEIYEGLRSGRVKVVVGTHALIEDPVEFANLGLVVVDEQHRFGVAQRAALRAKGANPHLLVMTATPIPRSLALTVYGDLDLSVLDEMPPGRQRIQTVLWPAKERERGYAFIRSQVEKGRQAFIIFPLVEESEKIDAKAAVAEHARLQSEVLPDLKLGLLHGRLKPDEKDEVMHKFRNGEYHVLVSTSVVEVGVDVPNATVMLIDGANRFGLAQLHQFRGRVGRGEHASFCVLISDAVNPAEDERLQAMVQSQDGFYLAEKDLELRGPGDFLGTRQSGFAGLRMARLGDLATIEKVRREARLLFERDPELELPEHALLAQRLHEFWTPGSGDAS